MKHIYAALVGMVSILLITGCSSTRQLALNTIEPAPVALSNSIKRIGVINRSLQENDQRTQDEVDQLILEENQWLHEKGTAAAIAGLMEELERDNRFDKVEFLGTVSEDSETPEEYGAVPWATLKNLCKERELDAIFSLAYYETDTEVSVKKTKMEERNLMRMKILVPAKEITLETLIENGWRIYDPFSEEVIDEFTLNDRLVSSAKGMDAFRAFQSIEDRKDSVIHKSRTSGNAYGLRLQPYQNVVYRDYFVKGTENFVLADQKAQEGDWKGVEELWTKEVENPNTKIKSRACYNLAVLNERKENFETAMEWASKANEYHDTKFTKEYLEVLKVRITRNNLVQEQLISSAYD